VRRIATILIAVLLTAVAAPIAGAATHEARAEALYQRALQRYSVASVDSQTAALADLEEATRLAPQRRDVLLTLGKKYLEMGRVERARSCLTRLARLGSDDFDTWYTLGMAWKQDWLHTIERSSLDEASHCLERATKVSPHNVEGWTAAASIALLRGRPRDAVLESARGCGVDPQSSEPALILAAGLYRLGAVAAADSVFRAARANFHDAWLDAFQWEGTDPDMTTPENEAELDGLTRWVLARFLFREGGRVRWDRRAELFVRYGPPAFVEIDPVWADLESAFPRHAHIRYAPDPIPFSFHMQVWHYPELGINALMWDRSLNYSFEFPYANDFSFDPVPNLGLVSARSDLVALDGGRGVFRALPPGAEPLSLKACVNRFPLAEGTRVVTHLFSPGTPADTLWGSWAVADHQGRVVHRESGPLSVSACAPGGEQLVEFATLLPPGDYRVDVAVHAGDRGRGVAHLGVHVGAPAAGLVMSDLVLTCESTPSTIDAVRFAPNVEKRIDADRSISLYYEIEGLGLAHDGLSRFAYTCTVRPLDRRGRLRGAVYEASREEENVGTHRRQFVAVPVQSLKAGTYEARIVVKDLVGGATVEGMVQFFKGPIRADDERP